MNFKIINKLLYAYRNLLMEQGGMDANWDRFRLDVRWNFFPVRVVRKRLSEEAVDGPSLKCSKPG